MRGKKNIYGRSRSWCSCPNRKFSALCILWQHRELNEPGSPKCGRYWELGHIGALQTIWKGNNEIFSSFWTRGDAPHPKVCSLFHLQAVNPSVRGEQREGQRAGGASCLGCTFPGLPRPGEVAGQLSDGEEQATMQWGPGGAQKMHFFCEYWGREASKAEREQQGMVSLMVGKEAAAVEIVRARQKHPSGRSNSRAAFIQGRLGI